MLFDADGPHIPVSLVRIQWSGILLFYRRPRLSRAAGLPLFGKLAERVYQRLGQALTGDPGGRGLEQSGADRSL
jgi:hypothetical protein